MGHVLARPEASSVYLPPHMLAVPLSSSSLFLLQNSAAAVLCLSVSIKLCHSVRISCLQLYIVPYLYHCLFDNVTKSHYLKGMCTLYQQSTVHSQ